MRAPMVSQTASRWIETLGRAEAGEFDLLDGILGDVIEIDGRPVSREALKAMVAGFFTLNPMVRTTFHDVWEDGDVVIARTTWAGILGVDWHDPQLGVIPGSAGREFSIQNIAIRRFENGRIVELRDAMDTLGLLRQVGAFDDR
jgi:predicted ester cyclase